MPSVPPPPNKLAIATISLGKHPSHTLERKIAAASSRGFRGLEVVYADLANHAGIPPHLHQGGSRLPSSYSHDDAQAEAAILASAHHISRLASEAGVTILSLSPLKNFEGRLGGDSLTDRLALASHWVDVALALGALHLQVPSQFLPAGTGQSTGDRGVVVAELRALADLVRDRSEEEEEEHGGRRLKVAYEAVAFGAHVRTWQEALAVVREVGRPGTLGLCLDSFHVHALLWADPYNETGGGSATGGDEDGGSRPGVALGGESALRRSMDEFVAACPKEWVFYVQLSDGSRLDPGVLRDRSEGNGFWQGLEVDDHRLAWSRSARPFPLEAPGYFPVAEMARTWLMEWGWEGWVSLEGFLAETAEEANGPEVMAERAERSIERVYQRLRE